MDSFLPLLILLLAFAPIRAEQSAGFVLNSWKAGLTAEEFRVFARASRITSKDFFPDYPDKPILSTIAIGTPARNFSVALESGCTTAFVLDATYESLQPGQPSYNASLSSTSKTAGSFDGFSGESEVYGHAYEDVFTWFAHGSEFTITQYFGSANSVSYGWFTDPALNGIDGVVGLSWNPGELQADRVAPIVNLLDLLGGERTYTQWLAEAVDEHGAHGYQVAIAFGRPLDDRCDSTTLNFVPLVYIDDVQSLAFQLDTLFMDQFKFQGGTLFNTLYCFTMDVGKTQMGLLTAMPATTSIHELHAASPAVCSALLRLQRGEAGGVLEKATVEWGRSDEYLGHVFRLRARTVELEGGEFVRALAAWGAFERNEALRTVGLFVRPGDAAAEQLAHWPAAVRALRSLNARLQLRVGRVEAARDCWKWPRFSLDDAAALLADRGARQLAAEDAAFSPRNARLFAFQHRESTIRLKLAENEEKRSEDSQETTEKPREKREEPRVSSVRLQHQPQAPILQEAARKRRDAFYPLPAQTPAPFIPLPAVPATPARLLSAEQRTELRKWVPKDIAGFPLPALPLKPGALQERRNEDLRSLVPTDFAGVPLPPPRLPPVTLIPLQPVTLQPLVQQPLTFQTIPHVRLVGLTN
ncbi:hypothetical protein M3Y99_00739700 [Aphelenchoides fujianensis]|nr:hypothetical protein M3Y99_00739700 [Aphelenchoides fujianensis]